MIMTHKEILLKGNAAIAAGNNEGFLIFCTEDTEWTFIGEQVLQGKQAVRDWMEKTYVKPPEVKVDDLISEGNKLVAAGELVMYDKNGKPGHFEYCDVWTFREGLIAGLKAFVVANEDRR